MGTRERERASLYLRGCSVSLILWPCGQHHSPFALTAAFAACRTDATGCCGSAQHPSVSIGRRVRVLGRLRNESIRMSAPPPLGIVHQLVREDKVSAGREAGRCRSSSLTHVPQSCRIGPRRRIRLPACLRPCASVAQHCANAGGADPDTRLRCEVVCRRSLGCHRQLRERAAPERRLSRHRHCAHRAQGAVDTEAAAHHWRSMRSNAPSRLCASRGSTSTAQCSPLDPPTVATVFAHTRRGACGVALCTRITHSNGGGRRAERQNCLDP